MEIEEAVATASCHSLHFNITKSNNQNLSFAFYSLTYRYRPWEWRRLGRNRLHAVVSRRLNRVLG